MCKRCGGFTYDVWDYDAGWEEKCAICGSLSQILTLEPGPERRDHEADQGLAMPEREATLERCPRRAVRVPPHVLDTCY